MNKTEQLLLINTESKEHHQLLDSECEIGRGWLNCYDKRISKKHGILELTSNESIKLTSTHVNPIFYRTKIDGTLLKINKNDEPIVLSAGDSFGLFPNTFWFEIVKSNMQRDEEKEMAASASVVEQSPNESVAEVSKRKLPFWLAGKNYNKMPNDNNEVTVSNDDNIAAAAAATDGNSTQIDNPQSTVAVQDLALETPTIDSVSDDSATTKRKMSSMNDGNDNKRIRSDVNVASASNGSESGSVEPEMDTSNEPNIPSTAIGTRSDCAMEVLNGPIGESNASKPEDKAIEPEPNERVEVHDATTENRTETSDAAVSGEPTTSVAGNPAETIDDDGLTVPLPKITIKTEPNDDIEQNVNDNTATAGPSGTVTVKEEIKTEVKLEPDSSIDSKPKRDCCPFGIRCYRRNPAHRVEMAHPGDSDYCLPSYGDPLPGAPPCPYGIRCYRRNPTHFRQFSHPSSTDPVANRKALRAKKEENSKKIDDDVDDDDSDDNNEDPFAGDDSSDDPDFFGDMASDDDDEESEKDSGHESIVAENEDD